MAGKMVEFPSNGGKTSGYLATPTSGKGPGVLVIQEWWGLVQHIKNVCDRFAAEGFTALAPDMYHGKTANEPDGAGKLFMALNIGQAEKDLRGAVDYLATQSSSQKVGAVGFCMGGQLALFAGTVNPKVGAVVDFYGIHPNVKPDYGKLGGPVLGLFAEKDQFVKPAGSLHADARFETPDEIASSLVRPHGHPKARTKGVESRGHDPDKGPWSTAQDKTSPYTAAFNKAAADDAWKKTLGFFRQHVK